MLIQFPIFSSNPLQNGRFPGNFKENTDFQQLRCCQLSRVKKTAPWWNSVPFVRLLIPFAGGILLYRFRLLWPMAAISAVFCLAVLCLRFLPVYRQFRLRFLWGLMLHLLLVTGGQFLMHYGDVKNSRAWFGSRTYECLIVTTLTEAKLNKWGYQTITADVNWIRHGGEWLPASGKVLLSLPAHLPALHPGSMIGFNNKPLDIVNRPESRGFDFAGYMALQQVFHQVRLQDDEIAIIKRTASSESLIISIRQNILGILDNHFTGEERALAKALLVGYRGELEKDLVTAYTNTGVIHIIAISGMHLGIIYAVLIMILKPLAAGKTPRVLINLLIMTVLWVFSFICGASPSVTRSAVMFSSILVGKSIGAENNTGNAVASSAFLLLCFDPLLLWDLGFQLSYAAVASLLIYNRAIVRIFSPENGILLLSWNSIATSLSAQILTTPLVLVHFHQFPLLFILSNFVAVPLSGIILILLILIIALQSFPLIPSVLATLTSWCIRFMNTQVERIASVRFSVWEEINWNWADLVLAYLAILAFTLFLRTKTASQLILFLLTILTWMISSKYSSL